MSWFDRLIGIEEKRAKEDRIISVLPGLERPGSNLLQVYGLSDVALPAVTIESALTVPAFLAAVSFLSRTLAALPLHSFRNTKDGPQKIKGGLETIIHEAPNPEWTSFKLRQHFWQQVFTGGRGLLYIERAGSNIVGLWPIDPSKAAVNRSHLGVTTYHVADRVYSASEIIDVPFMLRPDGVRHYSPVAMGATAIQLALAMNQYGSTFFAGGGVPPLALIGPPATGPGAVKRMVTDVQQAIDDARDTGKQIVPLPPNYELKPIGIDPDKGQMTDARKFQIEEIARILQIPPVFLQDLSNGTFSNTEQQDLFFVKHLVGQWADAFEEELNLKLFGQRNGGRYVEHNLDGLLRGDFVARMTALAAGVQNALLTPDEGRSLENRSARGGNADKLFMQGATVPIDGMNAAEGIADGV